MEPFKLSAARLRKSPEKIFGCTAHCTAYYLSSPIGSMVLLYMVTFTIHMPQMLAYNSIYTSTMDPMVLWVMLLHQVFSQAKTEISGVQKFGLLLRTPWSFSLNFRATFQGICPKFSQEYGFIIFCWRFLYLPVSNLQNYWVSQGLQCLPRLPRVQGFLVRLLRGAEGGDGWWDLDVATKAAEQWPNGTGFGMVCLNIYIYIYSILYIYIIYI